MIERGQQLRLIQPVHTPWGLYQRGHIVTILSAADGKFEVCLDMDGHIDLSRCHTATIRPEDLFVWPDDVEHGTQRAYRLHRRHMEPPCAVCRRGHRERDQARRMRTQDSILVPRAFLAQLLDTANLDALAEADRLWGQKAVDTIRDAS